MTLKRLAYVGGSIALVLFLAGVLFLGNQRLAEAQVSPDAPGMVCGIFDEFNTLSGSPFFDEDCGNDPGEEEIPEGNLPACFDTVDNDEDGFVDFPNDPGCDGYFDTDESNPEQLTPEEECVAAGGTWLEEEEDCNTLEEQQSECEAGGGTWNSETHVCTPAEDEGSGEEENNSPDSQPSGGGSGPTGGGGYPGGQVLGATTTLPQGIVCDQYMTAFIKPSGNNDSDQVYRLQALLSASENAGLELSGIYDEESILAVRTFQSKYAEDILAPWGITEPTGFVYLTTRKKMNEVYCQNTQQFPLTVEEEQIIEKAKLPAAAAAAVAAAAQAPEAEPQEKSVEIETPDDAPVVNTPSNVFNDFFRRLFDRFR